MNYLPKAKTENIVIQNLKDEVLIYDLKTDKAFCLNETAARVFNRCDGKTSAADLKHEQRLTDEIIYLALDGLEKQNLLEGEYVSPLAGMNRREIIKKVGLTSMIALPVISALVAPPAADSASTICPFEGISCVASPADCTRGAFFGLCLTSVQVLPTGPCNNTPSSAARVNCVCCRR